jgi:SNF2-related domain
MQYGPNLNHFAWWRLICDEAHEIVCYQRKKDGVDPSLGLRTLLDFTAVNKWYVTGTPFPHGIESLRGALRVMKQFSCLSFKEFFVINLIVIVVQQCLKPTGPPVGGAL